ncbi:MAG: signal peptidase II [Spirochaetales bacterium]
MRKNSLYIVFITLFANFAADRITKFLAVKYLYGHKNISILNNFIIIGFTINSGAFLGLGNTWPEIIKYIVFIVIPIIVCILMLLYCLLKEKDKVLIILITTFAAGGLGNLFDRLLNHFRVVDFLNFGIGSIRTGIVNIADLSITFAAILIAIYEFKKEQKAKNIKLS